MLFAPPPASAQLAEKPSAYVVKRQGGSVQGSTRADMRIASLQRIADRPDFDRIARVYGQGSEREIVHSLIVIDRARGNRIDYVNTARYPLHEDFVRARYLSGDSDRKALRASYSDPKRRFVFATIGYRHEAGRWMFEYWEGDRLTPEILALTAQRLAATFFAPVVFKANSAQQEEVARNSATPLVTEAELLGQRAYLPLNPGRVVGRLRLVADLEAEGEDDIEPGDIVVLREVPLALPPVAGVITERPSTVLS
ncbi:MAG: pyruvate, phosphate dikinase, partial [Pseudomonadota bacterium]|nr:pyruvate, phosphate dikinase [Pseudomonadota bacterium]